MKRWAVIGLLMLAVGCTPGTPEGHRPEAFPVPAAGTPSRAVKIYNLSGEPRPYVVSASRPERDTPKAELVPGVQYIVMYEGETFHLEVAPGVFSAHAKPSMEGQSAIMVGNGSLAMDKSFTPAYLARHSRHTSPACCRSCEELDCDDCTEHARNISCPEDAPAAANCAHWEEAVHCQPANLLP